MENLLIASGRTITSSSVTEEYHKYAQIENWWELEELRDRHKNHAKFPEEFTPSHLTIEDGVEIPAELLEDDLR